MNAKFSLARWIRGLAGAAAVAAIAAGQLARGQEEPPPLPPEHRVEHLIVFDARQTSAIERAGEALLKELGPGFTITVTKTPVCAASSCASAAPSECNGQSKCAEAVMHSQLATPISGVHICALENSAGRFVKQPCPCVATGDCVCDGVCKCATEAGCRVACLAECSAKACEAACGQEGCEVAVTHADETSGPCAERVHQRVRIHLEQVDILHHLVELAADRAAARAELESRKEASAKLAELYETLAEVVAVNAALETKLEAQVAHAKTLEKVAELAAENARLKAHVELAGGRSEASQQMISLTLENERLKLRLADLEHRQGAGEGLQTAERTARDRKAR